MALLGTRPDAEVAQRIGKTVDAVRQKREELGIANPFARTEGEKPAWTSEEDELVRTLPPAEAARHTGRTMAAVYGRRHALGLTRWQKTR